MRKNKEFLAALLIFSSILFCSMREVRADIPVFPGGTTLGALVAAGIAVLIIAILAFLLLRRIRKSSQKDANR